MICVIIGAPFLAGLIGGLFAHYLATKARIDLIKQDAKTALHNEAIERFADGYFRGYAAMTASRHQTFDKDMTLIMDLVR